jgi:hypothetical protein
METNEQREREREEADAQRRRWGKQRAQAPPSTAVNAAMAAQQRVAAMIVPEAGEDEENAMIAAVIALSMQPPMPPEGVVSHSSGGSGSGRSGGGSGGSSGGGSGGGAMIRLLEPEDEPTRATPANTPAAPQLAAEQAAALPHLPVASVASSHQEQAALPLGIAPSASVEPTPFASPDAHAASHMGEHEPTDAPSVPHDSSGDRKEWQRKWPCVRVRVHSDDGEWCVGDVQWRSAQVVVLRFADDCCEAEFDVSDHSCNHARISAAFDPLCSLMASIVRVAGCRA